MHRLLRPCSVVLVSVVTLSCVDLQRATAPDSDVVPTSPVRSRSAMEPAGLPLKREFSLLPPLTATSRPPGRFDATLLPGLAVEVCEWNGTSCGVTVTRLTAASRGSSALRLESDDGGHYHANWHTKDSGLSEAKSYRLRVLLEGREIGAAPLKVLAGGRKGSGRGGSTLEIQNGSTVPVKFWIGRERLAGDPSAPAAEAIPRLEYTSRTEDFRDDHPGLPGASISFNTVLLSLALHTTSEQANALLDQIDAIVVGSLPGTPGRVSGILYLRFPTRSHVEMIRLLEELRRSAIVEHVVQDVAVDMEAVPGRGSSTPASWVWDLNATGGNWGLELSRVPQMWNLRAAMAKKFEPGLLTLIVDDGFAIGHPDLDFIVNETPTVQHSHGTAVAGVVGARFDNDGIGIDGVNPFARMIVSADRRRWGETIQLLDRLIRDYDDVRVVNLSFGFPWDSLDTRQNQWARELAHRHGALLKLLLEELQADGVPLPVVISAAGNESDDGFGVQESKFASPMNNAALEHGVANIVVVEAVEADPFHAGGASRAAFSNVGGHLSAPGAGVMSTTTAPLLYDLVHGTSFAAPHVAGLVGYLYRLDPSLPRPTLTTNPILALLLKNAVPVGGGASPRVDAFASVMDVDSMQGGDRVLRMLVDIDDGTPDGNQRTDADGADYLEEDADQDRGPGDGSVDMSDFRRWRDWVLQMTIPHEHWLDGTLEHPKKDPNGDGRPLPGGQEDLFPRGDFNGSGEMLQDPSDVRRVQGAIRAEVTDLQVLQRVFADSNYTADQLPDLIRSGDLAIRGERCFAVPAVAMVRAEIRVTGEDVPVQTRVLDPASSVEIFTLPAEPADYTARVEARDASGQVVSSTELRVTIMLGSDDAWVPDCTPKLSLEVTPSDVTLDPGGSQQFNATVTGGAGNTEVTWSVSPTGTATISSTGLFTAGSTPGEYTVTATSVADPDVTAQATVRVNEAAGLPQNWGSYASLRGTIRAGSQRGSFQYISSESEGTSQILHIDKAESSSVTDGEATANSAASIRIDVSESGGTLHSVNGSGTINLSFVVGDVGAGGGARTFATSGYQLTFDVPAGSTEVTIGGTARASGHFTNGYAYVELRSGSDRLFLREVNSTEEGASGSLDLSHSMVLGPGSYVFHVGVSSNIAGLGSLDADGEFDFTITFSPPRPQS